MMHRRLFETASRSSRYAPKRETTFMRVWVKQGGKAAWPLFAMVGSMLGVLGMFAYHSLQSPEIHLNREERRSMERILNDKAEEAEKTQSWTNSVFHQGLSFMKKKEDNT